VVSVPTATIRDPSGAEATSARSTPVGIASPASASRQPRFASAEGAGTAAKQVKAAVASASRRSLPADTRLEVVVWRSVAVIGSSGLSASLPGLGPRGGAVGVLRGVPSRDRHLLGEYPPQA